EAYTSGEKDFSALISKLKEAKIDVIYLGGYHNDAGLIVRQSREQGLQANLVGGDALNSGEFWTISGPAGENTRFSDASSAVNLPAAKEVVEKFRSQQYEPEGYTLSSYAAVQAWAAAVTALNDTDDHKVADYFRSHSIETVMGNLSWDEKGDIKNPSYAWYIWSNGKFSQETK
ncbi:MAG: branched-chain amino acid ABC transporter substrate-binding protein, partial [Alphaproteobacteria bacterium]|nr:branched-chain amino acid ABC transporter substrate-binding protein [Alphaproteobacteria bacterium]